MRRETGEVYRWKAATGKVTKIKDSSEHEIGYKSGLEYVHKGHEHKLVFSPGPTGATRVRWRMVEYRAEAERLQKWRLVVISKAEVTAATQGAVEEGGGTGPTQTAVDVTMMSEGDVTMEGLEAGGESHQAAARDPTQELSQTEDVLAFWDRGSKRQRAPEGE